MFNHKLKLFTLSIYGPTLGKFRERIGTSALNLRMVRAAFWSVTGAVISRGLHLITTIVLARVLGKERFGELSIIQSSVAMFQVLADFGLGLTAMKYVAEFRIKDPIRAGKIIMLSNLFAIGSGAISALLLFILAPWIAINTLSAPHLKGPLRIAALMLFLGGINSAQIGALSGLEAFKASARVNVLTGLLNLTFVFIGVYWGGLEGALWGIMASLVVNCLLNNAAIKAEAHRSGIRVLLACSINEWKLLLKFTLPAFLSSLVIGPAAWLCNAMLVNQPGGYSALGLFAAADKWRQMLSFLPFSLSSFVLSILSNLHGMNNFDDYRKIFKMNLKLNLLAVLVSAIGLIALSQIAMSAYGGEFQKGWPTLIILSGSAIFVVLNNVLGQVVVSAGSIWLRCALDVLLASLMVGLSWVFIPLFQENGLAIANLIAFGATAFFLLIILRHRGPISGKISSIEYSKMPTQVWKAENR